MLCVVELCYVPVVPSLDLLIMHLCLVTGVTQHLCIVLGSGRYTIHSGSLPMMDERYIMVDLYIYISIEKDTSKYHIVSLVDIAVSRGLLNKGFGRYILLKRGFICKTSWNKLFPAFNQNSTSTIQYYTLSTS